VTTHYLDEAEHCRRLALMHAGRIAAMGTIRELKQVFADRAIIEVRTPSPMEALRALHGLPSVHKTSLFGTSLHAWLQPGARDTDPLQQRLRERGVRVESMESVTPSLEDVFMDVVERAGQA
jgi:ABC-2 type transport system ATP-binding protein